MAQGHLPSLSIRPLSLKLPYPRAIHHMSEELSQEEKLELLTSRRERRTPRPCTIPSMYATKKSSCKSSRKLFENLNRSFTVDNIGPKPVDIRQKMRSETPEGEEFEGEVCRGQASGATGSYTKRKTNHADEYQAGSSGEQKNQQYCIADDDTPTRKERSPVREKRPALSGKSLPVAAQSQPQTQPLPRRRRSRSGSGRSGVFGDSPQFILSIPRRTLPVRSHRPGYTASAIAASRARSSSRLRIGGATFPRGLPRTSVIDGAAGTSRFAHSLNSVVREIAKCPQSWDGQSDSTTATTATTSSCEATSTSTGSDSLAERALANAGGLTSSPARIFSPNSRSSPYKGNVRFSTSFDPSDVLPYDVAEDSFVANSKRKTIAAKQSAQQPLRYSSLETLIRKYAIISD